MCYIWATQDFNVDSNNVYKCECDQFKQLWHSRITCDAIDSNNIYIISVETSIFAPQRLRFYKGMGIAACTVGKVRASTVFMCVCSMFRPSDFLLFVKNGFVGAFAEGNSDPLKQIRPPAVAFSSAQLKQQLLL